MIVVESSTIQPVVMDPKDDVIVRKAPVSGRRVLSTAEADGWAASLTTFGIGGRLNWHTHDSEQILYVTEGRGIVATKETEYVVTPGCIVFIPAGENHWHGATDESSMTHLNVQKAGIHLAE
jgi:quercetin dioxygenase-like cupin family protein